MSAQGVLSKGTKFSVAVITSGTPGTAVDLSDDIQSIPSLGGTPEKVEITTLANGVRRYMNGIKDFGDLAFKFLFDNSDSSSAYRVLRAHEEADDLLQIVVELDDAITPTTGNGTKFTFDAKVSVSLDAADINQALTFTCNCALQSDIEVTNAA